MLDYPIIDPVAFSIFGLDIRWYGISYVVSILLAWWLLRIRKLPTAMRQLWRSERVDDLIFFALLGIILGGRMGYVLFYDWNNFIQNPLLLFNIRAGGMSFHGGLIGVLLGCCWFSYKHKIALLVTGDFLVPVVPIGLFFGRLGNFINGELWGKITTVPWAMVFPNAGSEARHPSQLYEAGLEGCLLFVVLWVYTTRARATGLASALFLFGYGILRFTVEFFREADSHLGYIAFGWLSMGQLLCLPMILAAIILVLMVTGKQRAMNTPAR